MRMPGANNAYPQRTFIEYFGVNLRPCLELWYVKDMVDQHLCELDGDVCRILRGVAGPGGPFHDRNLHGDSTGLSTIF